MQTASEPDDDTSFEPEVDSGSMLWQAKQTKLVANGAFCAEDVTRLLSQVRAQLCALCSLLMYLMAGTGSQVQGVAGLDSREVV